MAISKDLEPLIFKNFPLGANHGGASRNSAPPISNVFLRPWN
jgi:hypothetical protein